MTTHELRVERMLSQKISPQSGDSGQLGYKFKENQTKDFEEEPKFTIDIFDGGVEFTMSTYHYLVETLGTTKEVLKLDKELEDVLKSGKVNNVSEAMIELFESIESVNYSFESDNIRAQYTYNEENFLDQQIIRYLFPEMRNRMNGLLLSSEFIVIRSHNGADARAGFSKPYLFAVKDYAKLLQGQRTVNAFTESGLNAWSSDAGYSFHGDFTLEDLELNEDTARLRETDEFVTFSSIV